MNEYKDRRLPVKRNKATPDMTQDSTNAMISSVRSCLEASGLLHVSRLSTNMTITMSFLSA